MNNLLENSKENIFVAQSSTDNILDVIKDISIIKKINLLSDSSLNYLLIANNSQVDLEISTAGDNANLNIKCIFVADKNHPQKSKINVLLNDNKCKADVHIISFVLSEGNVDIFGAINAAQGIKGTTGRLFEENIILGKNIKIKNYPIMNVASDDIQISHGAKIDKIDQEKTFYMESKGLDSKQSKSLIIHGYINNFFEKFEEFGLSQLQNAKKQLTNSLI